MAQESVAEAADSLAARDYLELAELSGSFVHEIKNHLSTLGLNLQLLAEDFQEPQSHRERRALERVLRLQGECQRLVDVSNDFLRFARLRELDRAPADLAEVVEEMIDFFGPTARQAHIEIKSYVPAGLPPVLLDRELFKQALLNLFLNAQQAMPEGGSLTVQACEPSDSPGSVCLRLIDTGKGMAPEVAAKAFQPFFSTKKTGTGLGLATARRIVEAHGGTIAVESEPDRGTQFTIQLPTADAAG
jgi:signal transduction histidine kinase